MVDRLHPLTALGQAAPVVQEIGPVRIAERVDVALASLAPRRGRLADLERAAAVIGLPLPGPARAVEGHPWSAFWMTPEMWMVEAPFATHEDIAGALRKVFGDAASVTEQTDAWVCLELRAPDLAPLMARLCNVDVPKVPLGFATRTVIDHTGCYLIRRGEGVVTLYAPRSSARSFLHAMEVTAAAL